MVQHKAVLVFVCVLLCLSFIASLEVRRVSAAIPLTVNRTFSSSTYDGYILQLSGTYGGARNSSTGSVFDSQSFIEIGQTGVYSVARGFPFWDTSIIPDAANITNAVVSLYVYDDKSVVDFNVTVQSGQPTYPHTPMGSADFNYLYYSGDGGSRNTTTISGSGYWNITLNATGLSWIQKDGFTKLCLRSSRDIGYQEPSGNEYIRVYSSEQGSDYAPKLYVTYEFEGYNYIVHGPYYENGNVAPDIFNVSLSIENMPNENFILNGTGGTAQTQNVSVEQRGVAFTWNISSLNYTRTFTLTTAGFEEIWLFMPCPDTPFNLYTFTVTDFAGVTNGYLETVINVGGNNRVVERQSILLISDIPYWMEWARSYTIRLVCDQGSYTFGPFIALTDESQSLIITNDMFPTTYPGLNVTCNALRMNATWIQTNYTDNGLETVWVKVDFQYKKGYNWVSAYSVNNTGNTHQVNWYSADSSQNYRVVVTALRSGETKTWSFSCPKLATAEMVWEGLFDILGTFPFPGSYLFGLCIVFMVLGLFSYRYLAIGCALTWLMTAFLTYIGWLSAPWSLLSLTAFIIVLIALKEGKKTEREV